MDSDIKRRYMLKKYLKDNSNYKSDYYYDCELTKDNDMFVFYMYDHGYELYMGKGNTILEAISNIKDICNCYSKEYSCYKKFLSKLQKISFTYKPDEIIYIRVDCIFINNQIVNSEYIFCDKESTLEFLNSQHSQNDIIKIEKESNNKWIDITQKYKLYNSI